MISSDDLARLRIRRIIFHDIPKNSREGSNHPILADAETEINQSRSAILKNRLVRTLGSKSAYEIEFSPNASSPVQEEVTQFTNRRNRVANFIAMSQRLANNQGQTRFNSNINVKIPLIRV